MSLGAVFVYASWDKILDPAAFAQGIANYQIVSSRVGTLAAQFLPWLELVCGICLILNCWVQGTALVVALLMLIFMSALGYNIFRGVDISCGCFTLAQEAPASMWWYMARDSLLLAMAAGVMRYRYPDSCCRQHA
jgi:uncharacterized membrane protein YphA (DoxX/SURF4 family)